MVDAVVRFNSEDLLTEERIGNLVKKLKELVNLPDKKQQELMALMMERQVALTEITEARDARPGLPAWTRNLRFPAMRTKVSGNVLTVELRDSDARKALLAYIREITPEGIKRIRERTKEIKAGRRREKPLARPPSEAHLGQNLIRGVAA